MRLQRATSDDPAGLAPRLSPLPGRWAVDRLERELDWFLGEGSAQFERSTFGDQLARAELFSAGARRCSACEGSGFVACDSCVACRGMGWTPSLRHAARRLAITARPKPEPRQESGYWPGHGALELYATMSRLLLRVAQHKPILADVLVAYYGDRGARWGHHGAWGAGRLLAVYPLTTSGRRLLDMASRRGRNSELADDEQVASEHVVQQTQPQDMRRILLDRAMREAIALHLEARRVALALSGVRYA